MTETTLLARAVDILRRGGVVGIPTETVYGLAADAQNELAVRQIFAIKGRPSHHPLIVHLADLQSVRAWVREVPPEAEALAHAFWPGPLTLVLERSQLPSDAVTGGQATVAVRVPNHPVALALLKQFGSGLAAPSANRFGGVSPTTAEHVRADLGEAVELVLDGGPCEVGVESTIVDLSGEGPRLLRPGGIPHEALERVLQRPVKLQLSGAGEVRVPGTLASHYAPRAGVRLVGNAELCTEAQRYLDQGLKVAALVPPPTPLPPGVARYCLPEAPEERARRLFALLRQMDEDGCQMIVTTLPPAQGLDLAVRDRLSRAAAPRDGYS